MSMHKIVGLLLGGVLLLALPLPKNWQAPHAPPDLSVRDTAAMVQMGRYLFYDTQLSPTQTKSCESCHDQRFAFTDGYRKSIGLYGDVVRHNAQPIFNLLYNQSLTWADPRVEYLQQQIKIPLFGDKPHEMGIKGNEELIIKRIQQDTLYAKFYKTAFADATSPLSFDHVIVALSYFCESITSFNTDWDNDRLSQAAFRGQDLFYADSLNCTKCHLGMNFNHNRELEVITDNFWNIGLFNINDSGAYPPHDQGLFEITRQPQDMGKFRTPTLRNLAYTAPYFHDGSAATLGEVIDIYSRGGRLVDYGEYKGDGAKSVHKSKEIKTFQLTPQEKADLIAFLLSLSDSTFISNPAYSSPFKP